jgi:uncharacterized membrane protein
MGEGRERSDFLKLCAVPALAATGCLLLFGLRVAISGNTFYRYLVWNLFLAIVPYIIAAFGVRLLARLKDIRGRKLVAALTALLWVVFYPNAPYIFTDFIHVINKTYVRASPAEWLGLNDLLWYDLLMNAAFAFFGHFIGLVSMWFMESSLTKVWGVRAARILVAVAILFAGFGIYLGRFSRLNSWDILAAPRTVLAEIREATADPKALLFSVAFSVFVFLSYASLVLFKRLGAEVDSRTTSS